MPIRSLVRFTELSSALFLALLLAGYGSAWAQQPARPIPVKALLSEAGLPPISRPSVTPDGSSIAYTVIDNRRRGRGNGAGTYRPGLSALAGDIWTASLTSGSTNRITDAGNNWAPSWSPDGTRVAFFGDRDGRALAGEARLWVWERTTGQARQVSTLPVLDQSLDRPIWTADGRSVIVRTYPEGLSAEAYLRRAGTASDEPADTGASVTVFSFDPARPDSASAPNQLDLDRWLSDLAIVDLSTGAFRRFGRRQLNGTFRLSPDGKALAVVVVRGYTRSGAMDLSVDLVVYDLATGRAHTVVSGVTIAWDGFDWGFSWSPDGRSLAYRTGRFEPGGGYTGDQLFVVPVRGGRPRPLEPKARESEIDHTDDYRGPMWDPTGGRVYVMRDGALWQAGVSGEAAGLLASVDSLHLHMIEGPERGRLWVTRDGGSTVVVTLNPHTKRMGFARVDLKTGSVTQLTDAPQYIGEGYNPLVVTPDAGAVIYQAEDAGHPRNFWLLKPGDQPRPVTNLGSSLLSYGTPKSRLIEWRSLDGDTLRGALIYPTAYQAGTRYPMIVKVYGGYDLSNEVNRYGFAMTPFENLSVFASRGYAVLLTESKSRPGTAMLDLLKSVMPGVDRAIELGVADPNRLAVMGHSYGGYGTLALIAQTTRFRAAVMRAGMGSLTSAYGQLGPTGANYMLVWAEGGQGQMGGTLWEYRERYIENSPYFYLDRVRTPLLILHGDADPATSPYLTGEVFTGLRRLGQRVEYVRYAGELHWEPEWSTANQIDALSRMVAWFDRYVKGP